MKKNLENLWSRAYPQLPPWIRKPTRFAPLLVAAIVAAIVLAVTFQTPAQPVGAQVGIATRFHVFTNYNWNLLVYPASNNSVGISNYVGGTPGTTNNVLWLTNTQGVIVATNGGTEIPVNYGDNLGLFAYIQEPTNTGQTNTVSLNFDVSPFGGTNRTTAFAGVNTNLTNFGIEGGYTAILGTNTVASSNSSWWTWNLVCAGPGNFLFYTNISSTVMGGARYFRLTSVTNVATTATTGAGTNNTGVMVIASHFP